MGKRKLSFFLGLSFVAHLLFFSSLFFKYFYFFERKPLAGGGKNAKIEIQIVGGGGPPEMSNLSEARSTKAYEPSRGKTAGFQKTTPLPGGEGTKGRVADVATITLTPTLSPQGRGGSQGIGFGSSGDDPLLAEIRKRIEYAKRYPLLARKMGQQGRVFVRFSINEKGEPQGLELKQSSTFPALDEEALATIRRGAPYPPYPDPLELWIHFELN